MKLVELYFQDPKKPEGQRFLGAVLMREDSAPNNAEYARRAWSLGVNPGGEVVLLDVDSADLAGFTEAHLDRLLTEQECLDMNLFKRKDGK